MTFGELFLIYAWLQADTFGFISLLIFFLSLLGLLGYRRKFSYKGDDNYSTEDIKLFKRIHLPVIIASAVLVTILPSSQTIGIMIAGDQAMKALRSDTGQKLTGKAGEVIDRALDRALESLADKSEK